MKRPGKRTDVAGLLIEGHFGQPRELPTADPIAPTMMLLEIDCIQLYHRNPRRQPSELYAEIRDSIRSRGLDAPLRVTKRPGDDLYTVAAGGNTRLAILRELWMETQRPDFYRVPCLFAPWKSESDVLGAHLCENELRADLLLIDKAVALIELQALIEEEEGRELTRSEFARRLSEMGYKVSRRQLIRYAYAAEILEPSVPQALRAGLGVREIDRIRDLETAYRAFHQSLANAAEDAPGAFARLFAEALSAHDAALLDLDAVRRWLDERLAQTSGRRLNHVRLAVDALLSERAGRPDEGDSVQDLTAAPDRPPAPADDDGARAGNVAPANFDTPDPWPPADHDAHPSLEFDSSTGLRPQTDDFPISSVELAEIDHSADAEPLLPAALNIAPPLAAVTDDLKSLRSRHYVLALKFAQPFGLHSLVKPVAAGYGFLVDLPRAPPGSDSEWCAWWWLLALSEQNLTVERLASVPAFDEGDERFNALTPAPDPTALLFHLLTTQALTDRVFQDLLLLLECNRLLRRKFGAAAWESADAVGHAADLERFDDL